MKIHPLSRRRFLASSLASGLAAAGSLQFDRYAFALRTPSAVLTPEQEVGPFYLADEMLRADIAEGKPGVPLHLKFLVFHQATGEPLPNAAIDLWHCDALGLYSGFTTMKLGPPPGGMGRGPEGGPGGGPPGSAGPEHFGPPPSFDPGQPPPPGFAPGGDHGPPSPHPTDKLTFLRGIQMTGSDGTADFRTIFPGFYEGRTNHIHFKVRLDGHRSGRTYAAGHTAHTGQVFFPEELSVHLMKQGAYSAHEIHRTTMAEDHVYNDEQGALAMALVRSVQPGNPAAGLVAEFHAAVDPTATPAGVGMGRGPRS